MQSISSPKSHFLIIWESAKLPTKISLPSASLTLIILFGNRLFRNIIYVTYQDIQNVKVLLLKANRYRMSHFGMTWKLKMIRLVLIHGVTKFGKKNKKSVFQGCLVKMQPRLKKSLFANKAKANLWKDGNKESRRQIELKHRVQQIQEEETEQEKKRWKSQSRKCNYNSRWEIGEIVIE